MERQRPRHLGQFGLQSLRDFRLQRTSSWRSYRLCRRDSILRQGEWQVEETGDWFLRLKLADSVLSPSKGLSPSPSRQTFFSSPISSSFFLLFLTHLLSTPML